MKKKIIALITALTLAVSLSACGKHTPTSSNNSDADKRIAELEQELEELRAENKEDKQTEKEAESIQKEIESWTDDTIIAFTDKKMLEDVREITGVNERDITYGDVKNITEFSGSYQDIAPLKYFTSLTSLDIGTDNDTGLESLRTLSNLVSLKINSCDRLTDISAIGNLINLTDLSISSCDNITDISAIGNLTNLTDLYIDDCDNITDISAIGNLTNLTYLRISLSNLPSINNVEDLEEYLEEQYNSNE